MQILTNILEVISYTQQVRQVSTEIALVPTMGNLHAGHLSLVREALKEHQVCIVSIFVNPLQFGPNEDFEQYPRTFEDDKKKLMELNDEYPYSEIAIFSPQSMKVVFPTGYQTTIRNRVLEKQLCGKTRPTHFEGVLTVVYRLFRLLKPDTAIFGLKDFQQFKLIQAMVKDLELDIGLIGCPVVRDEQGLALSSRNQYLSQDEKVLALKLSSTLNEILEITKDRSWNEIKDSIKNLIESTTADHSYHWDYLEVRNKENLEEPDDDTRKFVVLGAIFFGNTRLIDNMYTPEKGSYVRSRFTPLA